MKADDFGPKPAVLRCARCGRFVDWEDARLQVVCACRPHLDLPPVLVQEATDTDREAARELFERDFGRTKIVAFGEIMDIDQMPMLAASVQVDLSGALGLPSSWRRLAHRRARDRSDVAARRGGGLPGR